jgi:hypothetical protein
VLAPVEVEALIAAMPTQRDRALVALMAYADLRHSYASLLIHERRSLPYVTAAMGPRERHHDPAPLHAPA